jgi:hypothetical protein
LSSILTAKVPIEESFSKGAVFNIVDFNIDVFIYQKKVLKAYLGKEKAEL